MAAAPIRQRAMRKTEYGSRYWATLAATRSPERRRYSSRRRSASEDESFHSKIAPAKSQAISAAGKLMAFAVTHRVGLQDMTGGRQKPFVGRHATIRINRPLHGKMAGHTL